MDEKEGTWTFDNIPPYSVAAIALARAIKTLGYENNIMRITDEEMEDASDTISVWYDNARRWWCVQVT